MGEGVDKDAGLKSWPDDTNIQRASVINVSLSPGVPPARQPSASSHHSHNPSAGSSRPLKTAQQGSHFQSQSKNFEFVLVTDNESRRQVRRHAMRQYMHQRRLDSIARLGPSRVSLAGWATRPASESLYVQPPAGKVSNVQTEGSPVKIEQGSPSSAENQLPTIKGESPCEEVKPGNGTSLSLVQKPIYSFPQAIPELDAVRDPFSSFPVPIKDADHQLIQHFVVTYPSMMYKFVHSTANNLNPMREIFRQLAIHDDLPFQAMLAIASKHRAGVEGRTESVQSLTHKMRALRLMNERIRVDSQGQRDGTIYAVATMAVIEKWSKDASIERMHFMALASMIRNRGGMQAMRTSSPFLEKVLYWVDFSCAAKAIVGTALPWTCSTPDIPPPGFDFLNPDVHLDIPHNSAAPQNTETLCDQFRACEDFLRFFRHLHERERAALNSPSPLASPTTPSRRKCFVPGTRLHTILTHLPDYDHGIRDIRFIDEYTGMTCLFFLAVALHHSYSTTTNFDHYLHWLDTTIDTLNPYENPSITSILWLFLQHDGFAPDQTNSTSTSTSPSSARSWVVSRLVRTAKTLEWKRNGTIWDSLRRILIDFLITQQECALGSEHVDAEALAARARRRDRRPALSYFWDEDEMRREILDEGVLELVVGGLS